MRQFTAGFTIAASAVLFSTLSVGQLQWLCAVLALVLSGLLQRGLSRAAVMTGAVLAGIGFTLISLQAHLAQVDKIPGGSTRVSARGVIQTIPRINSQVIRFRLKLDDFTVVENGHKSDERVITSGGVINVTCYRCPFVPQAGELWNFHLKLKPARGLSNPVGFDYERWLFQNRIIGRATVDNKGRNYRISNPVTGHGFDALRLRFMNYVNKGLELEHAGVITALTVGVRYQIDKVQWQLFRQTGTGHLMAISGLHIGMVFMLFYVICNGIWRIYPRALLLLPAQKLAAACALVPTLIYAMLAGWSLPTQRAVTMLLVFYVSYISNRGPPPWHGYCVAVLAVLLIEPFSPLSPGFWMSFCAVAAILWQADQYRNVNARGWRHRLLQLIRLQVVISLALVPCTLVLFDGTPLLSPLINLVAIPFFTFTVMPMVISAMAFWLVGLPGYSGRLLTGADWLLGYFLDFLHWIDQYPVYFDASPVTSLRIGIVLLLLLTLFRGQFKPLLATVLLSLLLVIVDDDVLSPGDYRLVMLDVGQGLAVTVETQNHVLLYDTGVRYHGGYDIGEIVVAPYLRRHLKGRELVVVLSHGDIDHTGGYEHIAANFPVQRTLASHRDMNHVRGQPCHAGQSWQWDGVEFHMLSPRRGFRGADNDGSCVMRISGAGGKVLLTGDIEAETEATLVNSKDVQSDYLLVPHHGSKTSSTDKFLVRVAAHTALISRGYGNRFGHPHGEVIERLRRRNMEILDTSTAGAVTLTVTSGGDTIVQNRLRHHHHWTWQSRQVEPINDSIAAFGTGT